jgi:hypothetical protein
VTNQTPVRAFTFPNGMMIVFDEHDEQVPDYQGRADEKLPKLRADFPDCEVNSARWDGSRDNPIIPDDLH